MCICMYVRMYGDWYNIVVFAVCAIGYVAYTPIYPVAYGTQVVQWTAGMCVECATYFL